MHRAVVALVALMTFAALTTSSCKRDAACREACMKLGIDSASEQCTLMCTTPCDELERTFGISVAKCEEMQRGELR